MAAAHNILIIDENPERAETIKQGLVESGHDSFEWIADFSNLPERIAVLDPDVILIDLEKPNRDALVPLFQICRNARRPVAIFVDSSESEMISAAVAAGIGAYIVDGLRKERIKPIVDMAVSRYEIFARLESELLSTRAALAQRKNIDRAKGILMTQQGVSEKQAYTMLRSAAMNQNRKLADVAASVVSAADLLK